MTADEQREQARADEYLRTHDADDLADAMTRALQAPAS